MIVAPTSFIQEIGGTSIPELPTSGEIATQPNGPRRTNAEAEWSWEPFLQLYMPIFRRELMRIVVALSRRPPGATIIAVLMGFSSLSCSSR